jgi:hypothetical protein
LKAIRIDIHGNIAGVDPPVRTGSAAGYATPDMLERLTRLAMRNRDRDQLHLLPSCQELAQVGLGEEVHGLARLLGHVIRLKFPRGQPAGAQRPVLQRVDARPARTPHGSHRRETCAWRRWT